jgi:hypothetical protein
MEVEYVLTPDDLYAFQLRAVHRSPISKRTRRNTYIYLFVAVLLFAIVPAIGADGFVISNVSFGFLIIGYAVVASLAWLLEKRMTRRAILQLLKEEKPDKGQLGQHTVKLDENSVMESTVVGEQRIFWAGVDRVEQNPHYIFIYTASAAALVIPKRAFASALEAETFHKLAIAHSNAARSGLVI